MWVLEGADEIRKRLPQFINVLGGLWQIIGKIHFGVLHAAQFVDSELETILVLVDEALNFEEVVLLEDVNELFDVVPHLGFDLAGAVAESERQIGLAGLLRLDLLRY